MHGLRTRIVLYKLYRWESNSVWLVTDANTSKHRSCRESGNSWVFETACQQFCACVHCKSMRTQCQKCLIMLQYFMETKYAQKQGTMSRVSSWMHPVRGQFEWGTCVLVRTIDLSRESIPSSWYLCIEGRRFWLLNLRVLSLLPLTSSLESEDQLIWYTGPTCPLSVPTNPPVFPSQIFMDLSNEALAIYLPSGENCTCMKRVQSTLTAIKEAKHNLPGGQWIWRTNLKGSNVVLVQGSTAIE